MENRISVVVADAHPLTVLGVRRLLEDEPDLAVVGTAQSERAATQCLEDHHPDILLLDSALPGLGAMGIGRWLSACDLATRVILLAGRDEASQAQRALQGGVRGYVLKRSPPEVLLQAIRATMTGGVFLDPDAVEQLIALRKPAPSRLQGGPTAITHLTERERDVLRLIALGFSHKEIAGRLGITSKSVETYKMRASDKLEIRTRAKIVQYAMHQGWMHDLTE